MNRKTVLKKRERFKAKETKPPKKSKQFKCN